MENVNVSIIKDLTLHKHDQKCWTSNCDFNFFVKKEILNQDFTLTNHHNHRLHHQMHNFCLTF